MPSLSPLRAAVQRCVPDTLFGRLALLLIAAVIVSHVLALTLMFELRPAHPGHPPTQGTRPARPRMPWLPMGARCRRRACGTRHPRYNWAYCWTSACA